MMRRRPAMLFLTFALLLALVPAQAQSAVRFNLIGPNGSVLLRNTTTDLTAFTWQVLTTATEYRLEVFRVSGNARFGVQIDVTVPTSACTTTVCTYTLSAAERDAFLTGEYAWTVTADTAGGDVEARNAPIYFKYNPEAIQFVGNGGFETGRINPWLTKNLTKDQIIVDPLLAYNGNAVWRFNGSPTEDSLIRQVFDASFYNIRPTDTFVVSAAYKMTGLNTRARLIVNMVYTDGTSSKHIVDLQPNSSFVVINEAFSPLKPVKTFAVILRNWSLAKTSRVWIDDVSLTLAGVGPLRRAPLPLPVPAQ